MNTNAEISEPPLTFDDLAQIDIARLKGVGEAKQRALHEYGISDVLELLMTYPRRWVDRTNQQRVADAALGEEVLLVVEVRGVEERQMRNRRKMVNVRVGDGTGTLRITFFNQPWRARQLTVGLVVAIHGKVEDYRGSFQMTNPVVDLIGDRTGRIVPIYPQSEKVRITTWELAALVDQALRRCESRGLADPLSVADQERLGLIGRFEALKSIHGPDSMADATAARRRLAFDELLRVQVELVRRKRELERTSQGIEHVVGGELVERFVGALPFPLTEAQRRAIDEIDTDMASPQPMHRLLQGDVGAGKTIVAVAALLNAVSGGHQGALMAPTEVLAEQHGSGVKALLDGLVVVDGDNLFGERPLRVELLTNRVTGQDRREVLAGLADGSVDIVIGTHALIQEGVEFGSLGAVVVDEQHRFGVEQRAALRAKSDGVVPDLLVMTATPIPRTAAMTVYGDLEVSALDELPPGRTPIATHWAAGPLSEANVWASVRDEVETGRQAYVVCPLIEESENLEVASAEETFEQLAAGELSNVRVGLLHGRMSSAEKEATMEAFRARELDVLVATTVIEVGVDVPNATVMVVLDADRFGIAQLHQLRGRVGRGEHASTCWLMTTSEDANPRIEALVASTDGFELAEIDLELRGEGTLMSSAQKGRSDLRLASLRRDRELIEQAREVAFRIIDDDPELAQSDVLRSEITLLLSEREGDYLTKS
ncbi:MAG: ATP-dependent DNA helicase RecG [Ilumatobacteraceae bacterium]|nr:ATP-dependent DNA helicase RecG [Actinomycetota bacterium]